MNRITLFTVLFLATAVGNAAADCAKNPVNGDAIDTLLTAKLVCGRPAGGYTGSPSDRWQEEHLSTGDLYDYKKGPTDKVDPRTKVGTWARSGNVVTYTYSPTKIFDYNVFLISGNTYSFCTVVKGKGVGTEVVRANIITSSTGCGGIFP